MFQVRRRDNTIVYSNESFLSARVRADHLQEVFNEHFDVYEVKQVYTTQTLEEFIKE